MLEAVSISELDPVAALGEKLAFAPGWRITGSRLIPNTWGERSVNSNRSPNLLVRAICCPGTASLSTLWSVFRKA
jgi:hypothetical protein